MDERSPGLILRTRPFSETSVIVHWLTPDLGRIATLAKGARRPKSPFQGKLDLFFLADFSFHRSRRSDLHHLREVSVRDFNPTLRRDLACLQQAAYFVQLLELTTETETPLPGFFQLMCAALATLPRQPPQAHTVLAFEIKLLHELGLLPDFQQPGLTPGSTEILKKLLNTDWNTIARLRPTPNQNSELAQFLARCLIDHAGRIPAGRQAALKVEAAS